MTGRRKAWSVARNGNQWRGGRAAALARLRDLNAAGTMLYPRPGAMRVMVDERYLMAALGALSRAWPEAATTLMMNSLQEVSV